MPKKDKKPKNTPIENEKFEDFVAEVEKPKNLQANLQIDVDRLADIIKGLEGDSKWRFLAEVHAIGLMKFSTEKLDEQTLDGKTFSDLISSGTLTAYQILFAGIDRVLPQEIDLILKQTYEYVLYGKNKDDDSAIGGWNQEQIDLLLSKVNFISSVTPDTPPEQEYVE